jgi:hypothetical protein
MPAGSDQLELTEPPHLAAHEVSDHHDPAPVEPLAIGGDLRGALVAPEAEHAVLAVQPQQVLSDLVALAGPQSADHAACRHGAHAPIATGRWAAAAETTAAARWSRRLPVDRFPAHDDGNVRAPQANLLELAIVICIELAV